MSAAFVLGTRVHSHLVLFDVMSLLTMKTAAVIQCDELLQDMSQGKVSLFVTFLIQRCLLHLLPITKPH